MTAYQKKENEIETKNLKQGTTKSGAQLFKVAIPADEIGDLLALIENQATERGVNLTFQVYERQGQRGTFEKAVFYVDGVQEPQSQHGGGGSRSASPAGTRKFVPKRSAANVLKGSVA